MKQGWRRAWWLVVSLALVFSGCASAYRSGQIAMQEGRYLEAASKFTEALADDPDRADALFGLGLAHYRAGLFRAAIGPFGRSVLAAPDSAEARLYLALTYLALEDQGAAIRQLKALQDLSVHPRIAVQAGRAVGLMEPGPLPAEIAEFIRQSLEDEILWQQDVLEARLAPHMYFGPAWFVGDPAGWHPLGFYPYGVPRP
ncbi:MAG TPA: tetratricopeptide repeat protein [Methylomirabilota bacterium]